MQQLAKDNESSYPLASKLALRDFYVDDFLSGADNLEEAIQIQHELSKLLKLGGFNLRKWASNSEKLLQNLPSKLLVHNEHEINLNKTIKTLGLHWNPASDSFGYNIDVDMTNNEEPTKRMILSEASKIFDPLGWLSPVTVVAKLLIQELWTSNLG